MGPILFVLVMVIRAKGALCVGCRACELACSLENFGVHNPKRARIRIEEQFPYPGRYVVHVCQQCNIPKCIEACPFDAIKQDASGKIVVTNKDACKTCKEQLCITACPFGAAFYFDGQLLVCTDCGACLRVCPRGVLSQDAVEVKE